MKVLQSGVSAFFWAAWTLLTLESRAHLGSKR
jgi:hypothetical protein